jgi:hypothetical protein
MLRRMVCLKRRYFVEWTKFRHEKTMAWRNDDDDDDGDGDDDEEEEEKEEENALARVSCCGKSTKLPQLYL